MSEEFFKVSQKGNPYVKFVDVGDKATGFLVGLREVPNNFTGKEGTFQRVYTLRIPDGEKQNAWDSGEKIVLAEGELIDVYGNSLVEENGRKISIIYGANKLKLGQKCRFELTELRDTGKPQKAKIIEPFFSNEMRPDLVEEYQKTQLQPVTGSAQGAEGAPF